MMTTTMMVMQRCAKDASALGMMLVQRAHASGMSSVARAEKGGTAGRAGTGMGFTLARARNATTDAAAEAAGRRESAGGIGVDGSRVASAQGSLPSSSARVDANGGPKSAKEKALEAALLQIVKSHGSGSIMKLGDNKEDISARLTQGVIPTGCLALDMALGIGGVPRGRVVEVFGPEASGKVREMHCEFSRMGWWGEGTREVPPPRRSRHAYVWQRLMTVSGDGRASPPTNARS